MTLFAKSLAAAATLLALGVSQSAHATAFAAWKVTGVEWNDTLNVRKFPANYSQKRSAIPDGTVLQMTGRCTGGVNLLDIAGLPAWKQRDTIRYEWCEVWHDPKQNGAFETGWVYGRYIRPY